MYSATTPKHTIAFPVPSEEIKAVVITYAQDGEIILEKSKDDLTFETVEQGGVEFYTGWLRLTQEETLKFDAQKGKYCMQVKALSYFDEVIAGDKRFYSVVPSLHEKVMT